MLHRTKLIAEPWDVGPNGYRVGEFPQGWSEWNDGYRDTVRDFWKGAPSSLGAFGNAVTGSSPLYELNGRTPTASINFVTSHDGFTLADVVAYNEKHNRVNGEANRDGHSDNRSWNSGAEGPTDDATVQEIRQRRIRSMATSLLLSQGVPMLLGGDELGRTQGGNNNAYNQDNEISWFDWENSDTDLADFFGRLTELRRGHPTFRRTAWLHEHADAEHDLVEWFALDGSPMTPSDWNDPEAQAVALYLAGRVVHCAAGTVSDDDVLLLFNAGFEDVEFQIPVAVGQAGWQIAVDSRDTDHTGAVSQAVVVGGFGTTVLMRPE